MNDDIVETLRIDIVQTLRILAGDVKGIRFHANKGTEGDFYRYAADEIERLQDKLKLSKLECQMADDAVQDLQNRLNAANAALRKAVRGE